LGLRVTFVFDAFETAMELLEISACCEPAVRTAAIYQLSQLCMWLTWLSTSKVIEVSMAIFTIKKLFSASLYTKQRAEQVSLICWVFFCKIFRYCTFCQFQQGICWACCLIVILLTFWLFVFTMLQHLGKFAYSLWKDFFSDRSIIFFLFIQW